jgi:hypothetical protein
VERLVAYIPCSFELRCDPCKNAPPKVESGWARSAIDQGLLYEFEEPESRESNESLPRTEIEKRTLRSLRWSDLRNKAPSCLKTYAVREGQLTGGIGKFRICLSYFDVPTGASLLIYTAKEVCTLDWLSDGRIDFGIGVGWNKEEVEACGYRWEDRGARCDEFLEVMQLLWTEPMVDFAGKWVKLETCRLDPKPIQKPHVPIIVGGYVEAALRRAVRFGAGWYGFNRDPAATKEMLNHLDAAFAKAGRRRGKEFQIIITPPVAMPMDAMQEYAEVGVDRLVVNLGSQRPERVDQRMAEIDKLVKMTH